MLKATGVVISWKRPQNIAKIVQRFVEQKWITDVVVWNNSGMPISRDFGTYRWTEFNDTKHGVAGDVGTLRDWRDANKTVRVVTSRSNVKILGRFAATQFAEQDVIATCDDDYIVHNWEEIARRFEDNSFQQLVACAVPGHAKAHTNGRWKWGSAELALLGWGSMWDRRWWPPIRDRYIAKYGHDECYYGKADRLFSIGLNQKHDVFAANVTAMGANDSTAIYRQSGHVTRMDEAHERAVALL